MSKVFQYYCKGKCAGYTPHVVLDQRTDDPLFNYSKVKCIHSCTTPFVIEHHKDQMVPTELSKRVEISTTI